MSPHPLPRTEELLASDPPAGEPAFPLSRIRSTLMVATLAALRAAEAEERYRVLVGPERYAFARALLPGAWVDIAEALEHYRAIDALQLSPSTLRGIGAEAARQLKGTVLSSLVKLAALASASPWLALEQTPRLVGRVWTGGGVKLYRSGPKEARLHFHDNVLMDMTAVRAALAATITTLLEGFATTVFTRGDDRFSRPGQCAFRVAWT
jgi:hypothetical protein